MADLVHSAGPHHFFVGTFIGFSILYFTFTGVAYFALTRLRPTKRCQSRPYRDRQIQIEVRRSMVSIFMFSVLSLFIWWGLRTGVFEIDFGFNPVRFALESVALFFWNELHFFAVHRFYHLKPFYKYHAHHHFSIVTTPFSAYSFHWSEGLLLGAVMPLIMLVHDFQFWSLMTLPLMSIVLNVIGHSNIDFFSSKPNTSLLCFSRRHSLHHQYPNTNYGFFLPYFDQILKMKKRP